MNAMRRKLLLTLLGSVFVYGCAAAAVLIVLVLEGCHRVAPAQ